MSTSLFGNGVPTGPDVDKLIARFGIPEIGSVISHADIAATLNAPTRNRLSSVVTAWRRRLDIQHNLLLVAVRGTGYEICTNSKRVQHSTDCYKSGLKRVRRAVEVAVRTDSLGLRPEEVRVRDHIVKTGGALQLAAATAAKQLKYPSS
jgi:hypothetical protein